jgi:MFS superfamily sulfate permease-like transporter
MSLSKNKKPFTGLKGIKYHWKDDFSAAISVALVALPLSLAIAVASGVPAISGLITAAVAGISTTFFRSSAITINGPAAGLIGVMLAGLAALDDGSGTAQAFKYLLAASAVAGALQVIIGILRFGRIAEIFPTSVIQGVLASIGIIIFAKQMHVAMGTSSDAENTMGTLIDIFYKIPEIDPKIAIISGLGIVLLLFHSKISYKAFHFIPAPVWVLIISVPIVLLYNYFEEHQIRIFGEIFSAPEQYLIDIPSNMKEALIFPDFSVAHTLNFWLVVISITLISSVITLSGVKAVDKLDPYKRKTKLNKDLVGVGVATMISSGIGGLPVLAVIVRSTVNVHNNAKTKWSNFYHGLLIIVFVLLLTPVIQMFPKAALAAVLVVTGVKLASPRVFKEIYAQGMEQLLFLVTTIIITLYYDPLIGLLGGILTTLMIHLLLSRVSIANFIQMVFYYRLKLTQNKDGVYQLKVKGVANFLTMLRLIGVLNKIPKGSTLVVDLSKTRLIDLTYQEKLMDFRRTHRLTGGKVQIVGLDEHVASSKHKLALKSLIPPNYNKITPREQEIKIMASQNNWMYTREEQIDTSELSEFEFFKMRPIESKENVIGSSFGELDVKWEVSDITFDEGAMLSKEVFHTTAELLHLPDEIPSFVLEKEDIFDKLIERVFSSNNIYLEHSPEFSNQFKLTASKKEAVQKFFDKKLVNFLLMQEVYRIESTGRMILIFKSLKQAKRSEIINIIDFSKKLCRHFDE